MSWKVVTKVRERRFGNAYRKAVMICLADRASDNGAGIWLGNKGIARETEISLNTVKKILRDFVDEGLIEDAGFHPRFRTQQHNILIPTLMKLPLLDPEGSDLTPPKSEGSNSDLRGHPMTPEGSPHDPKPKNPKLNLSAPAGASLPCEGAARLQALLESHCTHAHEERALQMMLDEVEAFDGRRILLKSRYMADRVSEALSGILKANNLIIVQDANLMRLEDETA